MSVEYSKPMRDAPASLGVTPLTEDQLAFVVGGDPKDIGDYGERYNNDGQDCTEGNAGTSGGVSVRVGDKVYEVKWESHVGGKVCSSHDSDRNGNGNNRHDNSGRD
jgi:hypothetical protein